MLISGLTVILAMAGMFLTGDKTFISFALGTILVVAIAIVSSLTVLPARAGLARGPGREGSLPFLSQWRNRPGSHGSGRRWSIV